MRVSAVRRQEWDAPTHLIQNCKSTHDGLVSKNILVMADGMCMPLSYLLESYAGTWQSEASRW